MTVLLCFNYIDITRHISPWQLHLSTSVYHPFAKYSVGKPGWQILSLKYISKYYPAVLIPKVQQQGIGKDTDLTQCWRENTIGDDVLLVKAPIL